MAKQKRIQLKSYDKLLKGFQYREALDAAVSSGRPEIISSLVEELATRSGLPAALGMTPVVNPSAIPGVLLPTPCAPVPAPCCTRTHPLLHLYPALLHPCCTHAAVPLLSPCCKPAVLLYAGVLG